MNIVEFAKGGGGKGGIGDAVAAVVGAATGSGGCGTGTVSGKRGFQPGNKCSKGRASDSPSNKASNAHRSARKSVSSHVKAGTLASEAGRDSVRTAARAHRELQAARVAQKSAKSSSGKANRAVASGRASALPATGTKPATAPAPKPTVADRVKASAKEASGVKVDRATQHLDDLRAAAKFGAVKPTDIHAHAERIARGATKDELFAAAKAAGIDHEGATTKKALVERIKDHAHAASKPGADKREATKAEANHPARERIDELMAASGAKSHEELAGHLKALAGDKGLLKAAGAKLAAKAPAPATTAKAAPPELNSSSRSALEWLRSVQARSTAMAPSEIDAHVSSISKLGAKELDAVAHHYLGSKVGGSKSAKLEAIGKKIHDFRQAADRVEGIKGPSPKAASPAATSIPHTDTKQAAYREHAKHIDSEHAPHVERLAAQVGMKPAEYKAALDRNLKAVTDHADAYIRVDSGTLPAILGSGRIKTQFETGTTNGSLDPSGRSKVESSLFGTKADVAPEHRPVYGYLDRPGFESAGKASQARIETYGDAVVKLKPHVKDRATITLGDSLARNDILRGSPASRPDSGSLPLGRPGWERGHKEFLDPATHVGDKIDKLTTDHAFIEAQYHGGIGHQDIAEVAFGHAPSQKTQAALQERGIPWRVAKTYH